MVAAPSLGRWSTTSEGVVLPAMALVHNMASAQTRLGIFGGTLCQWVACMMRIGIAFIRGIGTGCSASERFMALPSLLTWPCGWEYCGVLERSLMPMLGCEYWRGEKSAGR